MARIILALALLLGSGTTIGQSAATSEVYDYVEARRTAVYESVVADYEQAARDNPGDVVVARRHCDAIEYFVYSEDFYIEEAEAESVRCYEQLRERFPGHIEILLNDLQYRYDDAVLDDIGELDQNHGGSYNVSQRARLLVQVQLEQTYNNDNPEAAGFACLQALKLDIAVDCRLTAADHLHSGGQTDMAIDILESPLDPRDEPYYRAQKIAKLAEFGANDAVARQFALFSDDELGDPLRVQLSTALATVGLRDEALAMLGGVSEDYWNEAELLKSQFDVAMQFGDYDAAHGYYYERQALDAWNDPLLRQRFRLAGADLSLGWRAVDLVGLSSLLAMFVAVALIALLVPAGVHYRGLARLKNGIVPGTPTSAWSLRHAAYAMLVFLLLSVLSMYIFEFDLFYASYFGEAWAEPDWQSADLERMLIIDIIVMILLLSPLVVLKGRWRQLGTSEWSIGKCIGVGTGVAIAMRILFIIPISMNPELFGIGETMLTPEAIRRVYETYGLLTVLFVVAFLVPLAEEISFRGMILQGFSRHISALAANLIQSAMFAGMHENWLLFPFFMAFGFVAAVLARKAGGLLPAIIMHSVFNATAVLSLASLS